jgi:integrase
MEENLKSLSPKKLELKKTDKEDLLQGVRTDGKTYSVREHRMNWFMPPVWKEVYDKLGSERSKWTFEVLTQTGARINEARNIKKEDIDFERNTIKLRVTKTKARKGEKKGKPRTIPMNSEFIKKMKKVLKDKEDSDYIGILSTCGFNIALKNATEDSGIKDWYMFSAHNIRKTHGNWLKILGNLKLINCDAMEICLRLGHDYNTFLKDYGSAGVMDTKDVLIAKEILGDLYSR